MIACRVESHGVPDTKRVAQRAERTDIRGRQTALARGIEPELIKCDQGPATAWLIDVKQELKVASRVKHNCARLKIREREIVSPGTGLIIKRSTAGSVITLFSRIVLDPQEGLNHTGAGRLRLGENELCVAN